MGECWPSYEFTADTPGGQWTLPADTDLKWRPPRHCSITMPVTTYLVVASLLDSIFTRRVLSFFRFSFALFSLVKLCRSFVFRLLNSHTNSFVVRSFVVCSILTRRASSFVRFSIAQFSHVEFVVRSFFFRSILTRRASSFVRSIHT